MQPERPQPVSTGVLIVAAIAGVVVVVVAAIVSYAHMYGLALRAGEGDLAKLIPASVDGLVFFASTLLYAQHRSGEGKSKLAVFAAVLGVAMSIVANVVAKVPTLVPLTAIQVVVAAWAPAALGMVGHLAWKLLTLALRAREDAPQDASQEDHRTFVQAHIEHVSIGAQEHAGTSPEAAAREHRPELPALRPEVLPVSARKPSRRKAKDASRAMSDDDLMVFVRKLRDDLAAEGGKLTGYAVRKALQDDGHRVGNDRAGRLAERAMAEPGVSS